MSRNIVKLTAQRIRRRVVKPFIRVLPIGVQRFYRFRTSTARHQPEPELRELLRYLPANRRGVAIDVGANDGSVTYYLSSIFARVEAFEPNPILLREWGHCVPKNCNLWRFGLSDECTTVDLNVPVLNGHETPGWGSIGSPGCSEHDSINQYSIEVKTLDRCCGDSGPIDFIKIDVEGHELFVLRGAAKVIRRDHPWVVFESWPENRDRVFGFLEQHGYKVSNLRELTGIESSPQNFIAVPDESSVLKSDN